MKLGCSDRVESCGRGQFVESFQAFFFGMLGRVSDALVHLIELTYATTGSKLPIRLRRNIALAMLDGNLGGSFGEGVGEDSFEDEVGRSSRQRL